MNHELKEFIESDQKVPEVLYRSTLDLLLITLDPKKVLLKFFGLNLLGALLTLSICPQYGFGPYSGVTVFTNVIMSYGPIVCGILCAGIFFTGGYLLSYALLTATERKWVLRNNYSLMIPYISLVFMLGMSLKQLAPGHIHHDVTSFYVSWILAAFMVSVLISKSFKMLKKGVAF